MENELKSFRLNLVIAPSQVATIDAWRKEQDDLPSRSEAIRRLIDLGVQSAQSDRSPPNKKGVGSTDTQGQSK